MAENELTNPVSDGVPAHSTVTPRVLQSSVNLGRKPHSRIPAFHDDCKRVPVFRGTRPTALICSAPLPWNIIVNNEIKFTFNNGKRNWRCCVGCHIGGRKTVTVQHDF